MNNNNNNNNILYYLTNTFYFALKLDIYSIVYNVYILNQQEKQLQR